MTSTPSAHPDADPTRLPERVPAGRSLEGFWQGTLNIAGAQLRLVLKFVAMPDGTFTGTLDSPDQGALNLPIDAINLKDGSLHLRLMGLQGAYQGQLSADGSTITGHWKQRGRSLPLTFTRLEKAPEWVQSVLAQQIEGVWQGRLGRRGLRLILKLARTSEGTLAGTLDSPDQGATNWPLDGLVLMDRQVRFSLLRINALYEGVINKKGTKIVGHWRQRRRSFRLTFKRLSKDGGQRPLLDRVREWLAHLFT